MRLSRVPLAWLNLTHDRRRFAVALAGVSFAVVLMFVEMGFRNALFDSTTALIEHLDADLVVINKSRYVLSLDRHFPRGRLYQALEVAGVADAVALYVEAQRSSWKNPANGHTHPIRVLAYEPGRPALRLPRLNAQAAALELPETVLADARSKRSYGRLLPGVSAELAGRTVHVAGTFDLGTDFTNDGTLVMSDQSFAALFPRGRSQRDTLDQVDIGLLRLSPGADAAAVQAELRRDLPADVIVLTPGQLAAMEREFWRDSTPIGFIFGLGTVMGFLVGVIICYQILATDVADHLAEYATLKAIGYTDRFLTGVVMREAFWMALFGFIPGVLVSGLLYYFLAGATGLPMRLTPPRGGLVLALTVVMCSVSGIIALRKVQAADPAEVF